jgi:hypothetical protein
MINVLDLSYLQCINDDSLQIISEKLKNLKVLHLTQCEKITDKGLSYIVNKCTELEVLFLAKCILITDNTMKLISYLQKLTLLNICGTNITNNGIKYFDSDSDSKSKSKSKSKSNRKISIYAYNCIGVIKNNIPSNVVLFR